MKDAMDDEKSPRWLELAATLRSEPAAGTMARVRSRLEQSEPAWLTWLARPATLAVSAGLLAASAWFGVSLVPSGTFTSSDNATLAAALLQDDGSFGLGVDDAEATGEAGADSQEVAP